LVQYAPETNLPSELVLGRQKLSLISAETYDGIEKKFIDTGTNTIEGER